MDSSDATKTVLATPAVDADKRAGGRNKVVARKTNRVPVATVEVVLLGVAEDVRPVVAEDERLVAAEDARPVADKGVDATSGANPHRPRPS